MNSEQYVNLLTQDFPTAWFGHSELAIKLVSEFKPNVIVDLGVDYGFSTFCLAYSNIGQVYGVDWFQGDMHTGERNTYQHVMDLYEKVQTQHGISNVEIIKADFNELAKSWNKQIDILHIDGLHTYEAVKNDFDTWSKFTHDKSIVLFHDVESFVDTVGKFFEEIEGGYKLINTGSAGLGIYTKDKNTFDRIKTLM